MVRALVASHSASCCGPPSRNTPVCGSAYVPTAQVVWAGDSTDGSSGGAYETSAWSMDVTLRPTAWSNMTLYNATAGGRVRSAPPGRAFLTAVAFVQKVANATSCVAVMYGGEKDRSPTQDFVDDLLLVTLPMTASGSGLAGGAAFWEQLSPPAAGGPAWPLGRSYTASAQVGADAMLLHGGVACSLNDCSRNPLVALADVWMFNATRRAWAELPPVNAPPPARFAHAAIVNGDYLIIFGGRAFGSGGGGAMETLQDAWRMNLRTRE